MSQRLVFKNIEGNQAYLGKTVKMKGKVDGNHSWKKQF